MCDGRSAEEEKGRTGKAGRRNEGRDIEGEEVRARSRPFERAVESIVAAPRVESSIGLGT
jgi:hypothetical protein